MYAIRNKKTEKWVFGTDYRYAPARQRTSNNQAITFEYKRQAESEFKVRQCGKDYEIRKVELRVVEEAGEDA